MALSIFTSFIFFLYFFFLVVRLLPCVICRLSSLSFLASICIYVHPEHLKWLDYIYQSILEKTFVCQLNEFFVVFFLFSSFFFFTESPILKRESFKYHHSSMSSVLLRLGFCDWLEKYFYLEFFLLVVSTVSRMYYVIKGK